MTATIKLPRMLWETANTEPAYDVEGVVVSEILDDLFRQAPGLRNHIIEETGIVRPHVSIFVDGFQSDLDTNVGEGSEIRVLHAVSGG
jgi:molybdopterin converting factor small subunit